MPQYKIEIPYKRADRWLSENLTLSRNQIQNLMKSGHILINHQKRKPSHSLSPGDIIDVHIPPPPTTDITPQDIPIDIRYIDEDVIIVNKDAGMVVHPAQGHPKGTLVNALIHLIQKESGDPVRPGIVHRIDKGTSGLLVVARLPQSLTHLAKQFAEHTIQRSYLALVWGCPNPKQGSVEGPIGRHPQHRKQMAITPQGKPAKTHYRVLQHNPTADVSLLQCQLETGRTHQIRVHMRSKGYPLLCDPVYGRGKQPKWGRAILPDIDHQLLHASILGFDHPNKGYMEFHSTPPKDMQLVLEKLGFPTDPLSPSP